MTTTTTSPDLAAAVRRAMVGGHADDTERRFLTAAEKCAATFLKSDQPIMMTEGSSHYTVFEKIIGDVPWAREEMKKVVDELSVLNADQDAAVCGKYTIGVSAAYYFGLALGLRLAGGAR